MMIILIIQYKTLRCIIMQLIHNKICYLNCNYIIYLLYRLLNRSKGSRPTCSDLQKKYYRQILEKNIEKDMKGIEGFDLKALKKTYVDLNK